MLKTAFVIVGAILTATAMPSAALAQDGRTRAVSYADLDISGAAGQVRLDRRIDAAVRTVCGRAFPLDLGAVEEIRRCRSETFASAIADRRVGLVYVGQVSLR